MRKHENHGHNAKKAVVLKQGRSLKIPMTIVLTAAIILITAATVYYITNETTPKSSDLVTPANAVTSHVTYPVSMFNDGKAHHFDYKADGLTIRYFILKSSDGVIRAAFDACDVCWPAGKGYFQDGDNMVCRNCGRRFASKLVNEVKGGCNPAPLNRNVQGDKLVLKAEDILQGKSYFNFKKKA